MTQEVKLNVNIPKSALKQMKKEAVEEDMFLKEFVLHIFYLYEENKRKVRE
ncbi:MAG: hypothetical protein LBC39_02595 [Methanobrevibacter sp.]|nr:hypothetical protein [Candidatus Methanovirga aequatorialis]